MDSIVVDTDVVPFWFKDDTRISHYRRHLIGRLLIISFATIAELDEWATRRRWGTERRERTERHLQRFVLHPADRNLCRI
jgi:hypothetical protein